MNTRSDNLFDDHLDYRESAAWASVVYSMVPFLGLFFIPAAAVLTASEGFAAARRRDPFRSRNAALCGLSCIVVAAVQLLLWSLLYIIPIIGLT